MPKCKNCYHNDICVAFLDGSEMPDCDYFKDKVLIAELPCKVGEECIDKVKRNSIEFDNYGMSIYVEIIEVRRDTYFPDDFGESIFLTRQEAKKALEE